MFAAMCGGFTRWIFCLLASTVLMNKDYIPDGITAPSFILIGVTIYLLIVILPEIVHGQIYVQQLMFYRGNMDLPVSFIVAFVIPWVLASLVHYVDTILSMVCFFSATGFIFVAYANSFVFFCESVKEASHFETNFRLSLKQMYDGDRLSKKETSILPKSCQFLEIASARLDTSYEDAGASTTDMTSMLVKTTIDNPRYANIPGSIKCSQYPTTRLLKQSRKRSCRSDFDES